MSQATFLLRPSKTWRPPASPWLRSARVGVGGGGGGSPTGGDCRFSLPSPAPPPVSPLRPHSRHSYPRLSSALGLKVAAVTLGVA